MLGYIVSISKDSIKVSNADKSIFDEKSVNTAELGAQELADFIKATLGDNIAQKNKPPINIVVDSEDVILSFISSKKGQEEEFLHDEVNKKLAAFALTADDVYVSTQKIAPFVYQLVAVKKVFMDKILEVASLVGTPLATIVSWPLLVPKAVDKSGEPFIFLSSAEKGVQICLSELCGIYYSGKLKSAKIDGELVELIKKLSIYERKEPIKRIYTIGVPKVDVGEGFKVFEMAEKDEIEVFTTVFSEEYYDSQLNLLKLLPLPEAVKKLSAPVYAGIAAAIALVISGVVLWGGNFNSGSQNDVLSEAEESTESINEVSESTPTSVSEEKPADTESPQELKRAYLKIRVENGTNIGGLAGRTRDSLAKLGYEVVSVGDSDEADRESTLIRIAPSNSVYKDLLKTDLETIFESVEVLEDLEEDLEYDVLIVAGSK